MNVNADMAATTPIARTPNSRGAGMALQLAVDWKQLVGATTTPGSSSIARSTESIQSNE